MSRVLSKDFLEFLLNAMWFFLWLAGIPVSPNLIPVFQLCAASSSAWSPGGCHFAQPHGILPYPYEFSHKEPQHTFLEPLLLSSGTRSCCLRVQLPQPLWGVIPFFIARVTVPSDLPFLWHGQVNSRKLEWLHSACNLFSFSQDQSPLLPVVQCLKRAVLCILTTVLVIQARKTSL